MLNIADGRLLAVQIKWNRRMLEKNGMEWKERDLCGVCGAMMKANLKAVPKTANGNWGVKVVRVRLIGPAGLELVRCCFYPISSLYILSRLYLLSTSIPRLLQTD